MLAKSYLNSHPRDQWTAAAAAAAAVAGGCGCGCGPRVPLQS